MEKSESRLTLNPELLRTRFFQDCNRQLLEQFEEDDLRRFGSDDSYVELFLKHHEGDVDKALNMVKESFKWRKDFGVRAINESNLSAEVLKLAFLYRYHRDKDGNPTLTMVVKRHQRGSKMTEELKRLSAYLTEKTLNESPTQALTIIFDFEGADQSNFDLQMALFGANLFLKYYPSALGYVLLYDMPRIFDVIWRIIKPMVPKHLRRKVLFVNKDTIKRYVEERFLPTKMGGEDTSEYAYTPDV